MNKNILIPFFLLILIPLHSKTQNIIGDTIYVNSKVEVAIQFPSMPSSFFTNPVDAPYSLKTLGSGFTIIAKSKNTPPASLSVMEGKRSHYFTILYKRNINISNKAETFLDYSSVRNLEDHVKQKALDRDIDNRFETLVASAKNNAGEKKYDVAKQEYEEALKLKPKNKKAKKELKKIDKQLAAEAKKNSKKQNSKKTKKTAEPKKSELPYYSEAELKAKYPEINFSSPPPEQQFDETGYTLKKNTGTINEVLAEKPRLSIDDNSRKVKITCQSLSFKNKAVYMKLLIENKSKNDFLPGRMLLYWEKKKNNPEPLFPLFLSPDAFRVIKAGNEAIVIYVFKPANIADKDVLNFKMTDRLKKIKLDFNIKGEVYTEESIRMF